MLKEQAASHSLFLTRTEMASATKPLREENAINFSRKKRKEREKDERGLIKVALLGGVCRGDDDYLQVFRE